MKPETALSGPSPVCSTQGASRPWACSERKSPRSSRGRSRARALRTRAGPGARAVATSSGRDRARPRPELDSEDAEAEVGVRHERLELPLPRGAVALCEAVELGDIRLERGLEEHRRAVRERRRGRELGVEVLEAAPGELFAELAVGGGAGEERMPGAQHLVREARKRVVGDRVDRAAEACLALQDTDAPTVPGEQRRGSHRVDARPDEHRVEGRHGRRYHGPRLTCHQGAYDRIAACCCGRCRTRVRARSRRQSPSSRSTTAPVPSQGARRSST